MSKLFRTSLFGFNKKDVSGYIEKASGEFAATLEDKTSEIKVLGDKLSAALQQMELLMQSKAEYECAKETISNAIIQAEQKAASIVDDARRGAMEEKLRIQNEILKETASLQRIRLEAGNLRRSVIAVINRFAGEMEKHSDDAPVTAAVQPLDTEQAG